MFNRFIWIPLFMALLAGCAGGPQPVAGPPAPLSVILFAAGANWPIWVVESKGFCARERLAVKVPTPNSIFQLRGLIQGDFDIAMTAMDNVIAYREGQGEAGVSRPSLVAVMGADQGFLRVVAAPSIRSYGPASSLRDLGLPEASVDRATGLVLESAYPNPARWKAAPF